MGQSEQEDALSDIDHDPPKGQDAEDPFLIPPHGLEEESADEVVVKTLVEEPDNADGVDNGQDNRACGDRNKERIVQNRRDRDLGRILGRIMGRIPGQIMAHPAVFTACEAERSGARTVGIIIVNVVMTALYFCGTTMKPRQD